MSDRFNTCGKENVLSQLVKVQAQVRVTPLVKHGRPKVYCIDSSMKRRSDCGNNECHACGCDCDDCDLTCESDNNYDFTLTQLIRVEIPISFDAEVKIKKGISCCDRPVLNPDCEHDFKDDTKDKINNNQAAILMNRKIQF